LLAAVCIVEFIADKIPSSTVFGTVFILSFACRPERIDGFAFTDVSPTARLLAGLVGGLA
jgi:hypothetical protein